MPPLSAPNRLFGATFRNANSPFMLSKRHYVKHEYEGKGFRKILGPLWVYTTPPFLASYAVISTSFLLFLFPLDSKLYNVRKLKAEMDSKVGR